MIVGALLWHTITQLCSVVHDSKEEKGLCWDKEKSLFHWSGISAFNAKGVLVWVSTEMTVLWNVLRTKLMGVFINIYTYMGRGPYEDKVD